MELNFRLQNVDGRWVSPDDYPDAQGFIIIFTCNHCPYSIGSEGRLIALHERYAPLGYPVVAISSNDPEQYPQDSFEQMQVRARERGFPFAYLFDGTQEVAHAYGAERTPHAFLLHKGALGLEVLYRGAIDNHPKDASQVTESYLSRVLDSWLSEGWVTLSETPAIGCTIKWKKS
ncbi:MAG: thioredoxin family protein [Bacteroidia bacterium]|nr:thioredoxin family protein [Bacteroidia bacterium]